MEFVEQLLKQSKIPKSKHDDFLNALADQVEKDKHDMGVAERLELMEFCFDKTVQSVLHKLPETDEILRYRKCVRKHIATKIQVLRYYKELQGPSLEKSAFLLRPLFNSIV